jgi:phage gpG-like protein
MSEVRGFSSAIGDIARMRDRASDPRAALAEAAEIIGESIHRDFEVGGRPAWKPHAESTRRRTYGPSRLLMRKGTMENSFKPFVTRRTAGQRSSLVYGPRQNFGYEGGPGRGHSPTPARTFALLQPEDAERIGGVMLGHVVR